MSKKRIGIIEIEHSYRRSIYSGTQYTYQWLHDDEKYRLLEFDLSTEQIEHYAFSF